MNTTAHLRLAAVNIDGVLLNDTFSPVLHHFITSRHVPYTADVERRIFSQPQHIAFTELAEVTGLGLDWRAVKTLYFQERDQYLATRPVELNPGALSLLQRLRAAGLATVCYGGLSREHFDAFLGHADHLFDGPGYVCTNDFRPGIHEITTEIFGLEHGQALFIDDVARVAEVAKGLGTPFIGHPSTFPHGFQRHLMREAGTRHLASSLDAIDHTLLHLLDTEAAAGTVWDRDTLTV